MPHLRAQRRRLLAARDIASIAGHRPDVTERVPGQQHSARWSVENWLAVSDGPAQICRKRFGSASALRVSFVMMHRRFPLDRAADRCTRGSGQAGLFLV
jgi:hypothetical protein